MDLKEYLTIFKKNYKLFWIVVILIILIGLAFQYLRPLSYKANLMLNITRIGSQSTQDYKYDDFYRLQADERFADTVVRWLGSPAIVNEIYSDAKVSANRKGFKAQRLSSQMIQVSFITQDVKTAQELAGSVVKVLNIQTDKLNETQKEETWFQVLGADPIIAENKFKMEYVLLASLALGIFLGAWGVMVKHYIK